MRILLSGAAGSAGRSLPVLSTRGVVLVTPRGLYSYRPERRSWIDRILEMGKLDLVFYMLLIITGTSLAVVSLAWVLFQVQAIWAR